MTNDITGFLTSKTIHELTEVNRYVALLWWYRIAGNSEYVTLKQLHCDMIAAGYSNTNLSRLSAKPLLDKNVSSKEKGRSCRINVRAKEQLDIEYSHLVINGGAKNQLAFDLRKLATSLKQDEIKSFLLECVCAYEAGLYRSAVVMSWLAAVAVLQNEVINYHLADFNNEALRVNKDWKKAKNSDDLGLLREAFFLDRLEGISLIGKNVKAELKSCLDRRNGCGHPNSYKIAKNTASHHIETLLLNVFQVFPKN